MLRSAIIACCLLVPPLPAYAEDFTNTMFLAWDRQSQAGFFRTAIKTAALVIIRNNEQRGICIDRWYGSNPDQKEAYMLDIMRKYPDHHPVGIVLAVLEKQCGSAIFTNHR